MQQVSAQQPPASLVPWLRPEQLAERLGVAKSVLTQWRRQSAGPLAVRLGDARNSPVRYPEGDVLVWQATDEGKSLLAEAGGHLLGTEVSP
jgi:hypothetical protein